jgi:hypothetical protein
VPAAERSIDAHIECIQGDDRFCEGAASGAVDIDAMPIEMVPRSMMQAVQASP